MSRKYVCGDIKINLHRKGRVVNMFKGLNPGEDVIVDANDRVVCLARGAYRLDVDGEEFCVNTESDQIRIPVKSVVEKKSIGKAPISHYEWSGQRLERSDYINLERELDEAKDPYCIDDWGGSYSYPDLETEFSIRRKEENVKKWTPIFAEAPISWTVVEFKRVGEATDTGSEYIDCMVSRGTIGRGPFLIQTARLAYDTARAAAVKYGVDLNLNDTFGDRRKEIDFAKIGSNYPFRDLPDSLRKDKWTEFALTLDAAKARRDEIIKIITGIVYSHSDAGKDVRAADARIRRIINDLTSIIGNLYGIEMTKRSKGNPRTAIKTAETLKADMILALAESAEKADNVEV